MSATSSTAAQSSTNCPGLLRRPKSMVASFRRSSSLPLTTPDKPVIATSSSNKFGINVGLHRQPSGITRLVENEKGNFVFM